MGSGRPPVSGGVPQSSEVVRNSERLRFEVYQGEELAGVLEYQPHDGELALLHTRVARRFEGNGFGSRLTRAALDVARGEGLSVLPYCWFVRAWIARHNDYLDLVPEAHRERFGL